MPPNTVKVDRTTPFGNPFPLGQNRAASVAAFRKWISSTAKGKALARRARDELRGRNLACWCSLDGPCHADVLLVIANADRSTSLEESFAYELEKRSSHQGIAETALSGDRDALKDFAGLAAAAVPRNSALPEIRDALLYVLGQIQSGVEPNAAFGWNRAKPGRVPDDFMQLRKEMALCAHAWKLMHGTPRLKPTPALRAAAAAQNTSLENAKKIWSKWELRGKNGKVFGEK